MYRCAWYGCMVKYRGAWCYTWMYGDVYIGVYGDVQRYMVKYRGAWCYKWVYVQRYLVRSRGAWCWMVMHGVVQRCIKGGVKCCIVEIIYNNEVYKVCLGML